MKEEKRSHVSLVQLLRGIRTSPADQAALAPVKYLHIPLNCLEEWRNALREGQAPFPAAGFESSQGHFFPGSVRMDSDFLNFRDLEAGTTSELASESPPEPTQGHHAWLGRVVGWSDLLPGKANFLHRLQGNFRWANPIEPPALETFASGKANSVQTAA